MKICSFKLLMLSWMFWVNTSYKLLSSTNTQCAQVCRSETSGFYSPQIYVTSSNECYYLSSILSEYENIQMFEMVAKKIKLFDNTHDLQRMELFIVPSFKPSYDITMTSSPGCLDAIQHYNDGNKKANTLNGVMMIVLFLFIRWM